MSEMTPHESSARATARAKGWLEEPLTPGEKTFVGGLKGFIGGGVAGYVGGGLLDRGAAHEQFLFGAGFGACIGILFGILALIAGERLAAIKELALWVPVGALIGAAIFGGKYLADWAFGWTVHQWAQGILAAAVGAVFGGLLGALVGYLAGRRSRPQGKVSSDG
jgi:hypothetical protein